MSPRVWKASAREMVMVHYFCTVSTIDGHRQIVAPTTAVLQLRLHIIMILLCLFCFARNCCSAPEEVQVVRYLSSSHSIAVQLDSGRLDGVDQ